MVLGSGSRAQARLLELKFYIVGTEYENELNGIMTKASICLKATIKPDLILKGSESFDMFFYIVTKARARYLAPNEAQSPKNRGSFELNILSFSDSLFLFFGKKCLFRDGTDFPVNCCILGPVR